MVLFWSYALLLVFKVKLLLSIDKCVGIMFLESLLSTRWTGQSLSLYRFPRAMILITTTYYRPGANPWRVIEQIRTKLRIQAAAVQVPIGVEDQLSGVVDLVRWKAIYNEGQKG